MSVKRGSTVIISLFLTDQGVTPTGFTMLDAEDFKNLGLSNIGKKLVIKALQEVK